MDLANDLAAAYAEADMVDDPDGRIDALWQELGVPQDADEQQSEASGEDFVADGPLIEQVVPDDPLMTIWQAMLRQSVDAFQGRMQSFKDADAWPVTQADRKFALSLGCKFPLVGSSKESMAMVLLQDPQSGAVRPAYYPMHNVHGYAPIIFDAISHRVISGLFVFRRRRYSLQIQVPNSNPQSDPGHNWFPCCDCRHWHSDVKVSPCGTPASAGVCSSHPVNDVHSYKSSCAASRVLCMWARLRGSCPCHMPSLHVDSTPRLHI